MTNLAVMIAERNGAYKIFSAPNGKLFQVSRCPNWLSETFYNDYGYDAENHVGCVDEDCYCQPLHTT